MDSSGVAGILAARRGTVQPGVPGRVIQADRVVGRDGAERGVDGEALDRVGGDGVPLLLVPTATQDPLSWSRILNRRFYQSDDLVPGGRRREIQLHARTAETEEMPVALDKARNRHRTFEVDDLGSRSDQAPYLSVRAHCEDLLTPGSDPLDLS